ncbi:trypsin-like [Belonocnema kinseyi]|uniref:trypsin-like n=1 Tax=Belonocnema kinseyi TaxID=2817044 RepID=UPI00143DE8A5|nr:trypsin-like [Belonocnema kinseyi]
MREQTFLSLLVLCEISSQGFGSLSEENADESPNFHIRKKRLIDRTQPQNRGIPIERVPYVVKILKNDESNCAGNLLSRYIVLTSAYCLQEIATYSVLSGSPLMAYGNRHNITRTIFHNHFNPQTHDYDLAMIKISPPIYEKFSPNRQIEVSSTKVPTNILGEVSGWGCTSIGPGNYRLFRNKLQTIKIPIIDNISCQTIYGSQVHITHHHICTYDPSRLKGSCDRDGGDALVVNGKLVGVMSFRENSPTAGNPQVFMNLVDPEINEWIQRKMLPRFSSATNPIKNNCEFITLMLGVAKVLGGVCGVEIYRSPVRRYKSSLDKTPSHFC